jgi:CubicO group peptidase (beta-lactamase class C family)
LIAAGCGDRAGHPPGPSARSAVWQRTTPQEVGIDLRVIARADLTGVTSLLVARHGRLVVERYYGIQAADRVPVFSITKSVVSALIGLAIADGRLRGVNERLTDIVRGADRRIRLRHLLSMTAGYGRKLNFGDLDASALAARALANEPGTGFTYDSGSTDLLATVIIRTTGLSASQYAQRRLFGPMGIDDVRWPGSHGGSGLLLRPRELLAFGQLYLDGGRWNGRRILPAAWVQRSTQAHVEVPPGQGVTSDYGYGWWVEHRNGHFFEAHGYLGQVLAVFPRLDEVVVATSSGEDPGATDDLIRGVVRGTHE